VPVLFGICEGGLFALCFAALEPDRVAGLALAITPVDPHAAPAAPIARWTAAFSPEDIARLVACLGTVPGDAIGAAFQAMTPGRTRAKYTSGLLDLADDREALRDFLRMEAWLRDRPDHPGEAARQLLVEHYGESRLARGGWPLGGRLADPARLRLPIFSAYGLRDHLVPPETARAIGRVAPSAPLTDCPLDTGHVGVFVSRRARGQLAARLSAWLQASFGANRA
jgi:polyhydroxyalkanoate synthase